MELDGSIIVNGVDVTAAALMTNEFDSPIFDNRDTTVKAMPSSKRLPLAPDSIAVSEGYYQRARQ